MTMRQRKHRAAAKARLPEEWKRIYVALTKKERRALDALEKFLQDTP
jgi:hypothetical protein